MTRRGRPRTRVEVGEVLRLHLPALFADGYAVPDRFTSNRLVGDIEDGREVRFRLDVDLRGEPGRVTIAPDGAASYAVQLVSVVHPFGGRRWWLVCPVTGGRTSTLYWPPGAERFASREAHGLSYRSQRLDGQGREAEAAATIRAALGGEHAPAAQFPKRPKGMRRATYERHRERAGAG